MNPEVRDTFYKRSRILTEIRRYLDEKGFLEVDTPSWYRWRSALPPGPL